MVQKEKFEINKARSIKELIKKLNILQTHKMWACVSHRDRDREKKD